MERRIFENGKLCVKSCQFLINRNYIFHSVDTSPNVHMSDRNTKESNEKKGSVKKSTEASPTDVHPEQPTVKKQYFSFDKYVFLITPKKKQSIVDGYKLLLQTN